MRLSSRRSDADADVIRARLRALLEHDAAAGGWVPDGDDDPAGEETGRADDRACSTASRPTARVPENAAAPDPPDLPSGIGRHRVPGRASRWDPGRGGVRSLWVAGLVAALLLAGWTWLDRPRVEPAQPAPAGATHSSAEVDASTPSVGEAAETSEAVVVSVVGLVARPGLVTLPSGARVADAVQAAGGLLPGTDPAAVNLAAVVTDGAQISVGVPGVEGGSGGDTSPGAGTGLVDLNSATAADLDALPGIGPVLAQRIVDHRTRNGPFRTVDQLDDVPGIGPAIAAELTELVTV